MIRLLYAVILLFIGVTHAVANSNQEKANELVAWLRTFEGAYVSPKIEYQPIIVSSEENANIGLFAVEPLAKNETLFVIPRAALLTPKSHLDWKKQDNKTENEVDKDIQVRNDMCYLTWNLVRAYKAVQQGESNPFEPYVRYIFGDPVSDKEDNKRMSHLPSAWSGEGKKILARILGKELASTFLSESGSSLTNVDFTRTCRSMLLQNEGHPDLDFEWDEKDDDDEKYRLFRDAWYAVVSRSWNEVMIPVYDIINHRNGHWHNVDQASSVHLIKDQPADKPLVVVTLRDVAAGEPLHISYNECLDFDCHGLEGVYVLPYILKDYGFVEQYPRRWRLDIGENDEDHVLFEIDQVEPGNDDKLKVNWISSSPDPKTLTLDQMSLVRGNFLRQRDLREEIQKGVELLESAHERETILEFHQALITALQMLMEYSDPAEIQYRKFRRQMACVGSDSSSETCQAQYYDSLIPDQTLPGEDDDSDKEETAAFCSGDHSLYLGDAEVEVIDETESHYQEIRFEHDEEQGETCLYLSNWLQTCSSFRPHYHESVVHIPASFVDEVKRVIYLGGGDNYMLHEILKYPSLELVMGFELDQQVVRSSFKNLGTQPHFDNERVQWWFGDATKSLSMLPKTYWGTFDLVIVDLQTNVAETLQVTKDMTIMDAAMQLLKTEGGVLSRNEDFYPRRSVGFAKYEVDIELFDVPVLCQQSITMGSKSVDFLRKEPRNHGIDTVYLNKHKNHLKEADWFNYRNNGNVDISRCQTAPNEKQEGADLETIGQNRGFHLILEVEEATSVNEPIDKIRKNVKNALIRAGLNRKSIITSAMNEDANLFIIQEGYVLLSKRDKVHKYAAFDIKLWSSYDKAESIKAALIQAVGGSSSSAYRIVTGGMSGLPRKAATASLPKLLCGDVANVTPPIVTTETAPLAYTVTREALLVAPGTSVAVICADNTSSCGTLDALSSLESTIIPVRGCESDSMQEMMTCEDEILKALEDGVSRKGKIGAIVIDIDARKATGQVIHKILNDKQHRVRLLQATYVVISVAKADDDTQSWRSAFMERFKTDFEVFSPAYLSRILFNSTIDALQVDMFSAGSLTFYSHLRSILQDVEKQTGLVGEVRQVTDGKIGYIPDFYPAVVSNNEDYDLENADEQWATQSPIQHQTIFQYQVQAPLTPLATGERVLVEEKQDVWKGSWVPGRVVEIQEAETYIVALVRNDDDGEEEEEEMEVARSALRRLETESELEERELVLIRRSGGYWSQGAVIGKSAEGNSFHLRMFDSNGDTMTAKREDLVKRFEAGDTSHLPSMSSSGLREAFTKGLASVNIQAGDEGVRAFDGIVGTGSIHVAFWEAGVAVATWDGENHIEINFITNYEDAKIRTMFSETVLKEAPFLLIASRDEFPRGFGRVVNFPSDFDGDPHWLIEVDEEDA